MSKGKFKTMPMQFFGGRSGVLWYYTRSEYALWFLLGLIAILVQVFSYVFINIPLSVLILVK